MRATGVESSDLLAEEASLAQTPRAAASRFHLTLAGVECGFLKSCEGGTMTAEVVTEPPGPEHYLKKHLGAVAPEPLVLSFGLSMTNDVYDWINASWNGKPERRSGMITFVDADGQAKRALAFTDALITEVAFPKLDGSSKDPCILAVTLEPESTQRQKASGKPPTAAATKARQWLACNFRVEIDGLDCRRVSTVEAFPVRARHADAVGEKREVAARLEYPNLTFALAELGSESWFAWHDEYVIGGIGGDEHERKGSIALLGSALQDELGRIELDGLGIYRLRPEKAQASDGVARVVAELYCERMELAL